MLNSGAQHWKSIFPFSPVALYDIRSNGVEANSEWRGMPRMTNSHAPAAPGMHEQADVPSTVCPSWCCKSPHLARMLPADNGADCGADHASGSTLCADARMAATRNCKLGSCEKLL